MAVSGPTLVPSFISNDADFRAWAQAIHDKLAAVGLVQTGDTGQIAIGTATRPTLANTVAGYEVWRFADALQATTPVFIKIEYGSGQTVDRPSLWITVGAGSSGAGALNAQVTNRVQSAQGGSDPATTTRNLEASGDAGRIFLVASQNPGGPNYAHGFSVERLKDAAGNPVADGIFLLIVNAAGTGVGCVVPQTATVPSMGAVAPPAPNAGGVSAIGVDVVVAPQLAYCGKVFYTWLGFMNLLDMTGDTTFQAQMFGAVHTFRTVRQAVSGGILTFLWE